MRSFSTLTAPELGLHACGSARTLDCCALPAAAYKRWPAEPHLMPQPPVVAKSCSDPRALKAKVHYWRGTLVKSRPCWQVVPLPSPAFPPTCPDEHHPDPQSFCHSSLFPSPRFSQHSHPPCTSALPLYTPWQIMPRSLQSTSAIAPLCWHTCPSSGDDLECDTDFYLHYLSTGNLWPPPTLLISTLSLTRCISTFTPSYIIPWCVPPTNRYPHPGHVSLGITSPLLLESSDLFPVDLVSPPFSLDIVLYPLYSHLQVPTLSLSVLISHFDMMSQIFLLGHLLRRLLPSCGICFSFLQRILAHQNFGGVCNLN